MVRSTETGAPDVAELPGWVPGAVKNYLLHTESGLPIRALARENGCHASTILRQIRRFENLRDDVLIDEALCLLSRKYFQVSRSSAEPVKKDIVPMKLPTSKAVQLRDRASETSRGQLARQEKEERNALTRMAETGAVLVVAGDLDKAIVVRNLSGGKSVRTAVIDRETASSLALNDWISCTGKGKVTQYKITGAGRSALKRMISADPGQPGFNDMQAMFGDQHRIWGEKQMATGCEDEKPRRMRYNIAESPLTALARRRDKSGKPFLSDDLVHVGERLREDFELAQMGPRVAQNWERFLTGGGRGSFAADSGVGHGPDEARRRVSGALEHLGPGLGDVVLRCCCYLEGMEAAEKRMGWSARSGKIVLRIALQRLKRYYDETHGKFGPMIG